MNEIKKKQQDKLDKRAAKLRENLKRRKAVSQSRSTEKTKE